MVLRHSLIDAHGALRHDMSMTRTRFAMFFAICLLLPAWPVRSEVAQALGPTPGEIFLAHCAGRGREAAEAGQMTVVGEDGFLFLGAELRHIGKAVFWGKEAARASEATQPDAVDPLPVLIDFHENLKAEGVRLIFVPVPPKAVIYPDALVPGSPYDERFDVFHQAFYRHLRAAGVEVLDLTDAFLAARQEEGDPLYCRQDTHWSGRGLRIAAAAIAEAIGDADWRDTESFESSETTVEITGDLWSALGDDALPRETITLRTVPTENDPESPVLLLGDSHTLVFHSGGDMHARDAGLPGNLAKELGRSVETIGVRGSGSTSARLTLFRRAARDADYWGRKQVVVYCMTARDFTESIDGWRKLPIKP